MGVYSAQCTVPPLSHINTPPPPSANVRQPITNKSRPHCDNFGSFLRRPALALASTFFYVRMYTARSCSSSKTAVLLKGQNQYFLTIFVPKRAMSRGFTSRIPEISPRLRIFLVLDKFFPVTWYFSTSPVTFKSSHYHGEITRPRVKRSVHLINWCFKSRYFKNRLKLRTHAVGRMGINYMEGERHVDSSDACDVVHVHLICSQPGGRDPQNLV